MREIKFRGKRKDNNEWVYGYYVKVMDREGDDIDLICSIDTSYPRINGKWYLEDTTEVIPETVGQSTGLKDKNGKGTNEAYEGDIVIISCQSESNLRFKGVIKYSAPEFYVACFWEDCEGEQCSFPVGENNRSLIQGFWSIDEIIGDIHTKPELIKNNK